MATNVFDLNLESNSSGNVCDLSKKSRIMSSFLRDHLRKGSSKIIIIFHLLRAEIFNSVSIVSLAVLSSATAFGQVVAVISNTTFLRGYRMRDIIQYSTGIMTKPCMKPIIMTSDIVFTKT
uniref:Bm1418 n=1 Tax=Brugia malayi TaxID=6279 RepID=A0A1I9G3J5_BRUMA|nr:Bm1418 [Brugia malayi]